MTGGRGLQGGKRARFLGRQSLGVCVHECLVAENRFGGELVQAWFAPEVYCSQAYSAASSSVSPSWRIISRARSASSYAAETSACTLAAASSISGERRTVR